MDQLTFTLILSFDDGSRIVNADLQPEIDGETLTIEQVNHSIEEGGYSEYFILESGISALFQEEEQLRTQCQQLVADYLRIKETTSSDEDEVDSEEPSASPPQLSSEELTSVFEELGIELPSFEIAKQLDGKVEVSTKHQDFEAYVTVIPPFGGSPASKEDVQHAIKQAKITYGKMEEAIEGILEEGSPSDKPTLIAKGTKPVKGKDSGFKALVSSLITSGPKITDKGETNYKDINEFVLVQPGARLMRRTEPQPGKPGIDVFGKPIPAPMGELLPFHGDLEGAEVSKSDPNLLIASVKGHPIIVTRGVEVDPTLELKNVSLATGNIDFDGSVHVKEDVADGMKIKATGEVIVNGVVGKATIEAGSNVVIDQGLIGGTDAENEKDTQLHARVISKGSVKARFSTYAHIEAAKIISVKEYASHCELKAGDQIRIGQEGGKGNLIGGKSEAFNGVTAKCLGTKGSVVTEIRIGAAPDTLPKLRRIMQNIREREQKITEFNEQIHTIVTRAKLSGINDQQKEMLEKMNLAVKNLLKEIVDFRKEQKIVQSLLMKSKAARVTATQRIFQNVLVHILHTSKKVTEDIGQGKFKFEARQIVIER